MSHLTRDNFPYNKPIECKSGGYALFLQGLPISCSEKKIRDCFKTYGEILQIEMPFDRQTGGCQGFALIRYRDKDCANNARRDYDSAIMDESEISISWAFATSSVEKAMESETKERKGTLNKK
jgi:RNA recognition motif-containing protein